MTCTNSKDLKSFVILATLRDRRTLKTLKALMSKVAYATFLIQLHISTNEEKTIKASN